MADLDGGEWVKPLIPPGANSSWGDALCEMVGCLQSLSENRDQYVSDDFDMVVNHFIQQFFSQVGDNNGRIHSTVVKDVISFLVISNKNVADQLAEAMGDVRDSRSNKVVYKKFGSFLKKLQEKDQCLTVENTSYYHGSMSIETGEQENDPTQPWTAGSNAFHTPHNLPSMSEEAVVKPSHVSKTKNEQRSRGKWVLAPQAVRFHPGRIPDKETDKLSKNDYHAYIKRPDSQDAKDSLEIKRKNKNKATEILRDLIGQSRALTHSDDLRYSVYSCKDSVVNINAYDDSGKIITDTSGQVRTVPRCQFKLRLIHDNRYPESFVLENFQLDGKLITDHCSTCICKGSKVPLLRGPNSPDGKLPGLPSEIRDECSRMFQEGWYHQFNMTPTGLLTHLGSPTSPVREHPLVLATDDRSVSVLKHGVELFCKNHKAAASPCQLDPAMIPPASDASVAEWEAYQESNSLKIPDNFTPRPNGYRDEQDLADHLEVPHTKITQAFIVKPPTYAFLRHAIGIQTSFYDDEKMKKCLVFTSVKCLFQIYQVCTKVPEQARIRCADGSPGFVSIPCEESSTGGKRKLMLILTGFVGNSIKFHSGHKTPQPVTQRVYGNSFVLSGKGESSAAMLVMDTAMNQLLEDIFGRKVHLRPAVFLCDHGDAIPKAIRDYYNTWSGEDKVIILWCYFHTLAALKKKRSQWGMGGSENDTRYFQAQDYITRGHMCQTQPQKDMWEESFKDEFKDLPQFVGGFIKEYCGSKGSHFLKAGFPLGPNAQSSLEGLWSTLKRIPDIPADVTRNEFVQKVATKITQHLNRHNADNALVSKTSKNKKGAVCGVHCIEQLSEDGEPNHYMTSIPRPVLAVALLYSSYEENKLELPVDNDSHRILLRTIQKYFPYMSVNHMDEPILPEKVVLINRFQYQGMPIRESDFVLYSKSLDGCRDAFPGGFLEMEDRTMSRFCVVIHTKRSLIFGKDLNFWCLCPHFSREACCPGCVIVKDSLGLYNHRLHHLLRTGIGAMHKIPGFRQSRDSWSGASIRKDETPELRQIPLLYRATFLSTLGEAGTRRALVIGDFFNHRTVKRFEKVKFGRGGSSNLPHKQMWMFLVQHLPELAMASALCRYTVVAQGPNTSSSKDEKAIFLQQDTATNVSLARFVSKFKEHFHDVLRETTLEDAMEHEPLVVIEENETTLSQMRRVVSSLYVGGGRFWGDMPKKEEERRTTTITIGLHRRPTILQEDSEVDTLENHLNWDVATYDHSTIPEPVENHSPGDDLLSPEIADTLAKTVFRKEDGEESESCSSESSDSASDLSSPTGTSASRRMKRLKVEDTTCSDAYHKTCLICKDPMLPDLSHLEGANKRTEQSWAFHVRCVCKDPDFVHQKCLLTSWESAYNIRAPVESPSHVSHCYEFIRPTTMACQKCGTKPLLESDWRLCSQPPDEGINPRAAPANAEPILFGDTSFVGYCQFRDPITGDTMVKKVTTVLHWNSLILTNLLATGKWKKQSDEEQDQLMQLLYGRDLSPEVMFSMNDGAIFKALEDNLLIWGSPGVRGYVSDIQKLSGEKRNKAWLASGEYLSSFFMDTTKRTCPECGRDDRRWWEMVYLLAAPPTCRMRSVCVICVFSKLCTHVQDQQKEGNTASGIFLPRRFQCNGRCCSEYRQRGRMERLDGFMLYDKEGCGGKMMRKRLRDKQAESRAENGDKVLGMIKEEIPLIEAALMDVDNCLSI